MSNDGEHPLTKTYTVGGVWYEKFMDYGLLESMTKLDKVSIMLEEILPVIVRGPSIHGKQLWRFKSSSSHRRIFQKPYEQPFSVR